MDPASAPCAGRTRRDRRRVSRAVSHGPLPASRRLGRGENPRATHADHRTRRRSSNADRAPGQARPRSRGSDVRARLARTPDRAELHHVQCARSRYPGARALRCLPRPLDVLYLVVSRGGERAVQGLLRLRRSASPGARAHRAWVRRQTRRRLGLQHPRLVQRPVAPDDAARRLADAGEYRHPRTHAQHLLRAGRRGL